MGELHDLTAIEQATAIRAGKISSGELVEHYLHRIDRYSKEIGAFVTVTAEQARAAASKAGRDVAAVSGLEGVPVAIKDLILTAGVRTTFGSSVFAEYVPRVDADVVEFMQQAGLISLGKTTTSEFGLSLYSETNVAPPARNPWALEYTAGGSSGGSAAAVAAGLVPFALGNDGGGSLRIPASICGVVGFKPSRGVVSGGPLGFGGLGLPTNGPIARTVLDAAVLLDIISAPALGEPFAAPPRPADGFAHAAMRPEDHLPRNRPLRVGRYTAPMLADVALADDVRTVWEQAAATLAGLGCEIVDVPAPFEGTGEVDFQAVWQVLALSPVPPEREGELLPLTQWLRERGRTVSAERLLGALNEIQVRVRRHARKSAQFDLLLSPVLARSQAPVGWFTSAETPAADFRRQEEFSPYCVAYNLTGQPAVSLPCGSDADGNPIGVMLAAPVGSDALLIAVSAQLEAATPWAQRHPALWSA